MFFVNEIRQCFKNRSNDKDFYRSVCNLCKDNGVAVDCIESEVSIYYEGDIYKIEIIGDGVLVIENVLV